MIGESDAKVLEEYGKLFKSEKFSDVTLSIDGLEIPAHKIILVTRSRYFAAMFAHDTVENRQNRVTIADVKANVFESLLEFIYKGKVPVLNETNAEELLIASDQFQMDHLKSICVLDVNVSTTDTPIQDTPKVSRTRS